MTITKEFMKVTEHLALLLDKRPAEGEYPEWRDEFHRLGREFQKHADAIDAKPRFMTGNFLYMDDMRAKLETLSSLLLDDKDASEEWVKDVRESTMPISQMFVNIELT